ncbi:MAG: CYTH domain-containing protein, partial [Clostridia bacterium]|nr:CYTH domain-containing protein [Clostridia bacterium]
YEIQEFVSCIVNKSRKIFEYNGLLIKVDKFDDKCYVEFENVSNQNLKMLKDKLFLGEELNLSYYQIKKDQKDNSQSQECEIKLKINNNIDSFLINLPNKKQIFQTYLDIQDTNTKNFIYSFLPKNFDLSVYNEARIRTFNGKSYVTLKSKGGLVRNEYEKEIPNFMCANLDKLAIKGRIIKDRYDIIIKDDIVASIDNYKDRVLQVLEVEFNQNNYTPEQVIQIVKTQFPQFDFENVTNNIIYKNSSLAK